MTTQDFIDELREVSPLFVWSLEPETGMNAHLRRLPRLLIRAAEEGDGRGVVFEPMGALLYFRTGEIFTPAEWTKTGDALGLPPERAADLHAASNDATWAGEEGKREPIEYLETLRLRLLDAVGITPQTPHTPRRSGPRSRS